MACSTEPSYWCHQNPTRIIYDAISALPKYTSGNNILIITSPGFVKRGLVEQLENIFNKLNLVLYTEVQPNPCLDELDNVAQKFKDENIDLIIAIGGGSVIDTGKILSVLLPCDYNNVLGQFFRYEKKFYWKTKTPVIAIPTTAGTGAEVTPFATVWDHKNKKKHSLSSDFIYPNIAFLDPDLTISLPYQETLYTGLDTISHALESLWNKNQNPISRVFSFNALTLVINSLTKVLEEPNSREHRSKMLIASTLAGLAISDTKTAIAHSISYPLTAHYNIPHGLACSFTLEFLLNENIKEIAHDESELQTLNKVSQLLSSFLLADEIKKYASNIEIAKLKHEMQTLGRSDNYIFYPFNLENILLSALNKNE